MVEIMWGWYIIGQEYSVNIFFEKGSSLTKIFSTILQAQSHDEVILFLVTWVFVETDVNINQTSQV